MINNLNQQNWVNWVKSIEDNPNHNKIVVNNGSLQFLTPSNIKTIKCTTLTTKKIIEISKQILKENVVSAEQKSELSKGLKHIVESRNARYLHLNFIKKFFAVVFGYKKELNQWKKEINDLANKYLIPPKTNQLPRNNNQLPRNTNPPFSNPRQPTQPKKANPTDLGKSTLNNTPSKIDANTDQGTSTLKKPPEKAQEIIDFKSIYKPYAFAHQAGEKYENEQYELTSLLESVDLKEESDWKKPYMIDDIQLKSGIDFYMKDDYLKNPKNRTTLYLLSEKLAGRFLENGDFISAMKVRINAAGALHPDEKFVNIVQEIQDNQEEGLGTKISGLGSIYLKNHVFHAELRKKADLKPYVHLEAKLNHFFRTRFDQTIQFLIGNKQFKATAENKEQFKNSLPQGFCHSVEVTKDPDIYETVSSEGVYSNTGVTTATLYTINFAGVGKVKIGADPANYCQFNRVVVELDPSVKPLDAGEKMHIMLSSLGLGALAYPSRKIDYDRNKIFQLFRMYFPAISYDFERQEINFECSIPDLIEKLVNAVPKDKQGSISQKFKLCLEDQDENFMYRMEVYKNYHIWAMRNFANELKQNGAKGLFCGIGASESNVANVAQLVVNVIKKGALSSQDRFQNGMCNHGASSLTDLNGGGGDCVYTRMITESWINNQNISSCFAAGKVQLLYDLDVLERGGYAYLHDTYGKKTVDAYKKRKNLIEFAADLKNSPGSFGNEVMIKNRISKKHLKGILVQDHSMANTITNALKSNGIFKINDVAIEKLIHVGSSVPQEVFG